MAKLELISEATAMIGEAVFEGKKAKLEEEIQLEQETADNKIAALEKQRDQGLITDEQFAKGKEKIEAESAKKVAALKTKQAKADKVAALFNIAINTAQAILKATAQTGVLAGFVIPGIIAMGVLQAAIVAAQKIPKFAKGIDYSPEGLAEVGERGPELIISPSGEASLMDHSYTYLKKGSKVIPNRETEAILSAGYDSPEVRFMQLNNTMETGFNKVVNTVKNKRETHFDFRKRTIKDRFGTYWQEYYNRLMS